MNAECITGLVALAFVVIGLLVLARTHGPDNPLHPR